mmetsp:Transcript_6118/g.10118  ORF Transcript_6118/g.10118 Transcript_6118/m.10118 type:complete len:159 (-) Transcript_6118:7-483(-)
MALRVKAGRERTSMSIDVAVEVTTGDDGAACASGGGSRGLEKRRDVARKADVTVVNSGRANSAMSNSLSFGRRISSSLVLASLICAARNTADRALLPLDARETDLSSDVIWRGKLADGVENASTPDSDPVATAKQATVAKRWFRGRVIAMVHGGREVR